eukprot:484294_1
MRVLQHTVLFKLEEYESKDIKALEDQVQKMGKRIPGIICATFQENKTDYYKGYNDRRNGNNFTLLVIFQDDKAMKVYMDHDEHTQFKKIVGPFMKSITVVDYWQDNFPEFALYGHTMMSKNGPATATPGGFGTK